MNLSEQQRVFIAILRVKKKKGGDLIKVMLQQLSSSRVFFAVHFRFIGCFQKSPNTSVSNCAYSELNWALSSARRQGALFLKALVRSTVTYYKCRKRAKVKSAQKDNRRWADSERTLNGLGLVCPIAEVHSFCCNRHVFHSHSKASDQ